MSPETLQPRLIQKYSQENTYITYQGAQWLLWRSEYARYDNASNTFTRLRLQIFLASNSIVDKWITARPDTELWAQLEATVQ